MNPTDKEKITKLLPILTNNTTNVSQLLIFLIGEGVLLMNDRKRILAFPDDVDQCMELYELILKKDSTAFKKLVLGLSNTGNKHLAKLLQCEADEEKYRSFKNKEKGKSQVDYEDVNVLARILADDTNVIEKIDQFYGNLQLPPAELLPLQQTYKYDGFNSYNFLKSVLVKWISKMGDEADIDTIHSALESLSLSKASGDIQKFWTTK